MRTKYSIINSLTAVFFSLFVGLLSMYRLKVFIDVFGEPINGFFSLSNSVSLAITFVQAGLGGIFMQKLYVLLSKDDHQGIVDLFYSVNNICKIVTFLIFLISFVYSFLHISKYGYLFDGITVFLVYWLYMLPTVFSYYLRMPTFITMADQHGYIISIIGESMNIVSFLIQIVLMLLFPDLDIIVISLIIFICTMTGYIINYYISFNRYPFLKTLKPSKKYFDKDVLVKMGQSVGASLANSVMTSVDTLMLAYVAPQSTTDSLTLISVLTIYQGIISMVKSMLSNMFYQVISSFGNLFSTDFDKFKPTFYSFLKIGLPLLKVAGTK